MSNASIPTMAAIIDMLNQVADDVRFNSQALQPAVIERRLHQLVHDLEYYIPGLNPPTGTANATIYVHAADAARRDGQDGEAMALALRGLTYAPHNPQLWYICAAASVELCRLECAMRLMFHVLWINPGHTQARHDLEAITASFGEQGEPYAP